MSNNKFQGKYITAYSKEEKQAVKGYCHYCSVQTYHGEEIVPCVIVATPFESYVTVQITRVVPETIELAEHKEQAKCFMKEFELGKTFSYFGVNNGFNREMEVMIVGTQTRTGKAGVYLTLVELPKDYQYKDHVIAFTTSEDLLAVHNNL